MRLQTIHAAVAATASLAVSAASASLVYDASVLAPMQGFGNAPRDLTLHATGQDTFESGGLAVGPGGTIVFGSVIDDASVHLGNGVTNEAGLSSLPAPHEGNQKYDIPTIGSLGITDASQIGVLFNATEPMGDSVSVLDVTLKFYGSDGSFLGAIDGQQTFANSNPGNGVAGFTFVIDQAQQAFVNGLLAYGPTTTMALEASIGNFSGGPESFLVYNLAAVNAVPEPETYALLLGGLAFTGVFVRRRAAR